MRPATLKRRRLTLAEDHFGHPVAQRAVVVDLREAEILVRQMAQLVDGGIDAGAAACDGGEQAAQSTLFYGVPPGWLCWFSLAVMGQWGSTDFTNDHRGRRG